MIDLKLFKEMYDEIDKKVQEIRVLPMLYRQEKDYDGWELEDTGNKIYIVINSSSYYSGCDTSYSYVTIPLDEINNSVIWFREKFQNEIDEKERVEKELKLEKEREKQEQKKRFEEIQRKKDLETYERVKKELEKNNKS